MEIRESKKGFTLLEIMIVVAIIGILVAIAVPGWVKARRRAQSIACQENLSKIDSAKQQWALQANQPGSAAPAWTDLVLAGRQGYLVKTPECPSSGTYTIAAVDSAPTCTYVTVNPDHTLP